MSTFRARLSLDCLDGRILPTVTPVPPGTGGIDPTPIYPAIPPVVEPAPMSKAAWEAKYDLAMSQGEELGQLIDSLISLYRYREQARSAFTAALADPNASPETVEFLGANFTTLNDLWTQSLAMVQGKQGVYLDTVKIVLDNSNETTNPGNLRSLQLLPQFDYVDEAYIRDRQIS